MIDVRLKRIYETPDDGDGRRYLVERLWPRGVSKERARLAGWLKDAAPSAELRRWYDHDPAKWPEFRLRYFSELEAGRESLAPLLAAAEEGRVTLVFAAKEPALSCAAALKEFLEGRARP